MCPSFVGRSETPLDLLQSTSPTSRVMTENSNSRLRVPGRIVRGHSLLTRPVFIPGRTNHIRLFPTKHAFSYSYLLVGIPVGWKGSAGRMLSVDLQSRSQESGSDGKRQEGKRRSTWFSVEAEHYLNRGDPHEGLDGRLKAYLRSQVSGSSTELAD